MDSKNEKLYKTTDIALASTLLLMNFEFKGVEPTNQAQNKRTGRPDLFHFVFTDEDRRKEIVMKYASSSEEIKVKPNEFRSTMRYLKEQTRNYGQAQGNSEDGN